MRQKDTNVLKSLPFILDPSSLTTKRGWYQNLRCYEVMVFGTLFDTHSEYELISLKGCPRDTNYRIHS